MRPLDPHTKLQGLSDPEIAEQWDLEVTRLAYKVGLEFNGRKLKGGPTLNALVLYFLLKIDQTTRNEMISWGLAELERILSSEPPCKEDVATPPTFPGRSESIDHARKAVGKKGG